MKGKNLEKLVSNLKDVMRCPHCSNKYSLEDISYLGQLDSMTFLHMRCAGCKTPVFASIALGNEEGELFSTNISKEDIVLTDPQLSIEDYTLDNGFEYKTLDNDPEMTEIPLEHLTAEKIMSSLTPVAYDDVLDMHAYMAGFNGDFERVLN